METIYNARFVIWHVIMVDYINNVVDVSWKMSLIQRLSKIKTQTLPLVNGVLGILHVVDSSNFCCQGT